MTLALWQILIVIVTATTATYVMFALFVKSADAYAENGNSERVTAAVFAGLGMFVCIFLRSIDYSPDTQAYYSFFTQYCYTDISDLDLDYKVSFFALNIAILGSCDPNYLIPGWSILFALPFAFMPMDRIARVQLFALAIVSFIGIELTTNIFRQGLSSAFMLLGFAWFRRKPWVAVPAIAFALALHPSGALVLVAIALAALPWRYFFVGFAALIALVLVYANTTTGIGFIDRFFYEMNKYGSIEDSEIYIRFLAVAQLCIPLYCAWLARQWNDQDQHSAKKSWMFSLRLALTSLPFLTMPYFGYRYVYGLYMVVLFLNYRQIASRKSTAYELAFFGSLAISLAWAYGSTLVRTSPFLEL